MRKTSSTFFNAISGLDKISFEALMHSEREIVAGGAHEEFAIFIPPFVQNFQIPLYPGSGPQALLFVGFQKVLP